MKSTEITVDLDAIWKETRVKALSSANPFMIEFLKTQALREYVGDWTSYIKGSDLFDQLTSTNYNAEIDALLKRHGCTPAHLGGVDCWSLLYPPTLKKGLREDYEAMLETLKQFEHDNKEDL